MENDEAILLAVVEAFTEEVPALLEQLDVALASNDVVTAERAAHTLKGNFRILQLEEQQARWSEIEKRLGENGLENLTNAVESATVVTRQVLDYLEQYLRENQ